MSRVLLVTGGLGFIGKNFCKYFSFEYDEKIIIDKVSYASDLEFFNSDLKPAGWKLIVNDISNIKDIKDILGTHSIDIVHFAAESHVDNSFELSELFLKENTLSTLKLLNYINSSDAEIRLLHISTDEVYGQVSGSAATELTRLHPTNPYAATKAAGDLLAQTYRTCFNLNLKIIRANNIYGPRQFEEKLIPKAILNSKRSKNFVLHGTKKVKRHFVHVEDFVNAIEVVFTNWDTDKFYIYNIAGDVSYLISNIVSEIYSQNGLMPSQFIAIGPDRHFNDIEYHVNDSRIRALGWKPKKDFWKELMKLNQQSSVLEKKDFDL